MSIESAADWTGLRRVARVATLTLETLAREVRPGVTTGELDAMGVQQFAGALRTADGGFSAHHEHTLVITRGAPIALTAAAA